MWVLHGCWPSVTHSKKPRRPTEESQSGETHREVSLMLLLCVPEQGSWTTLRSSSTNTRDIRSNNNHNSLQMPAERRAIAASSDSQATNETPSRLQDWKKYHRKLNRWMLIKVGQASAQEGQRDVVLMFHCKDVQAATWPRIRIFEHFQLISINIYFQSSLLTVIRCHIMALYIQLICMVL